MKHELQANTIEILNIINAAVTNVCNNLEQRMNQRKDFMKLRLDNRIRIIEHNIEEIIQFLDGLHYQLPNDH